MRLICVFKGQKLIDQSSFFHESTASQFKENCSVQAGIPIEELDVVMFDDADIDGYYNSGKYNNKKSIKITKDKMFLLDLVSSPTVVDVAVNWMNCTDQQILEYFSVDDQQKISENKAYFESLGNEKFSAGFTFSWPHEITAPIISTVGVEGTYTETKEILGQAI
jgi:hypothetical protein